MSTALAIIGALAALFLCLPFAVWSVLWYVGNRVSTSGLYDVQDDLMALPDVPLHVKQAAWANMWQAIAADERTKVYDWSAPLVCAIALIGLPQSASRLPKWARKWDNNVSINGDGAAVLRGGQWLTLRDDVEALPGERIYTYDDPLYAGDAYYAKGHHPRSLWARYVWVGLRNRASQLSVDLGADVAARPVLISGSLDINRHDKPGHFLLKDGSSYHFKSIQPTRILGVRCAIIRSCGYKLEIALMRPPGAYGRVAAVAIGCSYKRWKD